MPSIKQPTFVQSNVSTISLNDDKAESESLSCIITTKETIHEILSSSSVHGVPNLTNTKHILIKIMWICFMLTSGSACVYFVIQSITTYLQYNPVSELEIKNEQYSEFPTISFCSSAGGFGRDSNYNGLRDSMISCTFNADASCLNNYEQFFESYIDPLYGYCYRFNSGTDLFGNHIDIQNSTFSGIQYGFQLELKLYSPYDYTQLIIRIHNKTQSLVSLNNEETYISSGSASYIAVARTFYELLEEPYNSCLKNLGQFTGDQTIINYIKNMNRSYTQKECYRLCGNLLYNQTNKCNCYSNSLDSTQFDCLYKASSLNLLDCTFNYYKQFTQNSFNLCENYCPLECDSISYAVTFNSIYDYPYAGSIFGATDQTFSEQFASYDDLKKTFFSISIFYPDLNYLLVRQDPKILLIDLIPNIGGTIGLFLGTSFLSFIEILEILSVILFYIIPDTMFHSNKVKVSNKK